MEPSGAPWRVLEPDTPSNGHAQPRPEQRDPPVVAIAVGVAVVIAAIAIFVATRADPGVDVVAVSGASGLAEVAAPLPSTSELVVEVGGAVARPGVYRLPPGARVGDAITAAGGFGARVDAGLADRQLNLAAIIRDGDEIHVPGRDDPTPQGVGSGGTASGGGGATAAGGLIDLNSASADELDTLPGVGPATAAKIIAAREEQRFASLEDVAARKVVGQATMAKIRPLITVGP